MQLGKLFTLKADSDREKIGSWDLGQRYLDKESFSNTDQGGEKRQEQINMIENETLCSQMAVDWIDPGDRHNVFFLFVSVHFCMFERFPYTHAHT